MSFSAGDLYVLEFYFLRPPDTVININPITAVIMPPVPKSHF